MNFLRRGRRGHANDRYANDTTHTDTHTGTHTGTNTGMTEKHQKHHRREKSNRARFDINSGDFNRRPSFGQWLKMTWLDIVTMAAMGAIGLGVYNADPAPSRSFPITFSDGEIVYPEFAYPLRHEIVPIWEAALLASLIPIAVILLMQIRIRSFWDVNNAIIGLLYSLITAAVFQVFIKWLIGGLRPHFLYVCAPDITKVVAGGQGFGNIMFQRDVCTGDRNEINDSLESMPSGHSTAAWAGFLYLYFYLNAKLKVFSNYHPAMWKIIVTYAPVLGAFLITGTLTIDEYHNWYDCLAGAVIGSVMAISAYRMVYASVWDFRFNHIPLTRHTPFSFGAGAAGAGGFETAVFTRKAGWGYEEAYGGAPFDAAHHLRGAEAGFNTNLVDNSGSHGHHNKHGANGAHDATATHVNQSNYGNSGTHDNNIVNDRGRQQDYNQGAHQGVHQGVTHSHNQDYNQGVNQGIHGHNQGLTGADTYGAAGTHGVHNTHGGLGHHRQGDIEHHAATVPQEPIEDHNRYRMHSRSLERKALNRNSGGL